MRMSDWYTPEPWMADKQFRITFNFTANGPRTTETITAKTMSDACAQIEAKHGKSARIGAIA